MIRERLVLAVFLLSAPLALAQHWDIEQVDQPEWGASVEMRWHPDGRLFLCYSDTAGIIRLASKDSIWSYEDLPQWRPVVSGTQGFDIGRHGRIGVAYMSTDCHRRYALKTDSGWTDVQTPFTLEIPYYPCLTTLDSAEAPTMTIQAGDAYLLARLRDTAWVTNNLANGYSGFTNDFDCSAIGSTPDGAVWGVFRYGYSFPRTFVYGSSLSRFRADSEVTVVSIAGVVGGGIGAASGCVDGQDSVHSCYELYPGLCLDEEEIDTTAAYHTSIRFDSLGRPQIAYVAANGGLLYRYRDAGVWHVFDLQTSGLTALALILDENSQPLIAYTSSAGVFLAHGVDVAGQSEESKPQAASLKPQVTVVRGVLRVPVSLFTIHTSLFDMSGRQVMALHPGANDVSGLSPGVYFVREAQARTQAQAVSKVLIVR